MKTLKSLAISRTLCKSKWRYLIFQKFGPHSNNLVCSISNLMDKWVYDLISTKSGLDSMFGNTDHIENLT